MRKPFKTDFGSEIIFAQEDWFTGSFISIAEGKKMEEKTAEFDIIFYIDEGMGTFTINGTAYEFGWGKTVLIRKGTKYSIECHSPLRVIKITQNILKDKDFSGGKEK